MDVIALVFLTYRIGLKAEKKGQPKLRWRLFVVFCWVSFEILGFMIGFLISRSVYLAALLGLACGLGGYLLAKYRLDQLPDNVPDKNRMDRIGQEDQP